MSILENILRIMENAQDNMLSDDFMRLSGILRTNKAAVRERIHEMTSEEMSHVIWKFNINEPLSPQEMDLVKLWIVGADETYTEMENRFQKWAEELKLLAKELKPFDSDDLTVRDYFRLQGVLDDAIRISANIGNFLELKERTERFHRLAQNMSPTDKELLTKILKMKLDNTDT